MLKSFAAAAFATFVLAMLAPKAFAAPVPLTLINGWTNAPFNTSIAAFENIGGIVHLKGAIATGGSNPVAFILPASARPVKDVYVPVDQANATNGRLRIQPSGAVTVQAETSFSNARTFTSLDGVWFDRNAPAFTPLVLANGWVNGPFNTSKAAYRNIGGVVTFAGAIATGGSNPVAFILPASARPVKDVYVPVDQANATNGRLRIQPSGAVFVEAETSFSYARTFTSLDGVSFDRNAPGFTPLPLANGWINGPFGTSLATFRVAGGIVQFAGDMATAGSNPVAFTLPANARPAKSVFVKVSLCNAANGRLFIQPSGVVSVQAETTFNYAQCSTSLEGASFIQ